MTTVQESVTPCGIGLQLLKQRKQSTECLGIGGPNRLKVSYSIVVDSDQEYTKDDMTSPTSAVLLRIKEVGICDRFCMNPAIVY